MADSQAQIHDFSFQFKFKDLFLDFLACLVPGFVFFISITLLVGGLFYVVASSIIFESSDIFTNFAFFTKEIFHSYTFQLWLSLAVIFISFIVGHLLYRLNPKTPDYASFIRIRQKVISEKDDWVIPLGQGIISQEVQFPYINLKKYLERRGFSYLANHIFWNSEIVETENGIKNISQRSKSFINKLKIRIFYSFPNKTIQIIRNEAHIRLASSVWYAAKYIIKTSYFCIFFIIALTVVFFYIKFVPQFKDYKISIIYVIIILIYLAGLFCKYRSDKKMGSWREKYHHKNKNENNEKNVAIIKLKEDEATKFRERILTYFNFYDLSPLGTFIFLLIAQFWMYSYYSDTKATFLLRHLILYNIISSFLLIGAVFVKRRIEETIHYQRVREINYVLETASLGNLFGDYFYFENEMANLNKLLQKGLITDEEHKNTKKEILNKFNLIKRK